MDFLVGVVVALYLVAEEIDGMVVALQQVAAAAALVALLDRQAIELEGSPEQRQSLLLGHGLTVAPTQPPRSVKTR